MNACKNRFVPLFVALGASVLLQGCFPLGLLGLAGSYGIVKTADTVGEVGDATTQLINNTSEQLTLTAGQIRTTLASIDVLVQHITKDADSLTAATTGNLTKLTDELTRQLQGLGQLRQQIQDTIAQGGKDVGNTLANVDALIQSTKASLDAVTTLLSLANSAVGKAVNPAAKARQPSHQEIAEASTAYFATRTAQPTLAESPAPGQPVPGGNPMPAFDLGAAP